MNSNKSALRKWFSNKRRSRNKKQLSSKLLRLIYYRLIVPMKREKDQPHNIAYGVFFGLFIAFTPTVGLQMPICFLTWWVARRVFNFHFSLILSIAWSWLSNPASMIPLYFIYYETGSFILNLGKDSGSNFAKFTELFADANFHDIREALEFLSFLWKTIGLSIWIGCIPYAIVFGLIGYHLSLAIARSYQKLKKQRQLKKKSLPSNDRRAN